MTGTDGPHRRLAGWLTERLGGPARSKVIAVLAGVLALDAADKGMLGAVAVQLQHDLGIGKTQVGLLLSVTSGVAAVATLAAGGMVDRMHRTRLLAVAIALWGVAMVAGGLATSFVFLLLTRLFLGAVAAVAGPAVASLIGDLFPIRERGRIYGLVLAGELVGTGFGLVVSGQIAAAAGWRPAFWALAVPPVALALLVWRLREPARGGASQIPRGATEIPVPGGQGPRPAGGSRPAGDGSGGGTDEEGVRSGSTAPDARRVVGDFGVQPDAARVLGEDPRRMPLWRVVRYVLRIRTNVALIVASALGYFYFNGVRGFAAQWAQQQYDVSLATAIGFVPVIGIGALVGVFVGGRLGDRLLGRGRLSGRVLVGSVAFVATALAIAPALLSHALVIGIPSLTIGAVCLAAANPPLDAARLDVMPPLLWGRAEGVRSVLRLGAEAAAPLLFGFVAEHVFTGAAGLQYTFLVMLVTPVAAGTVLWFGRRTYPRDVATADASARG